MPNSRVPCVPAALRPSWWLLVVVGLAASLVGAMAALQPVAAAGDCTVPAAAAAMDGEEHRLLDLINAYRKQNGLGALAPSPTLSRAAAWKVADMAAKSYFGHTDSLGRLPHAMNLDCGYPGRITGENLAAGSGDAATTLNMWKNSPTHNQNMLRPFSAAGLGRHAGGAYGVYWALEMGDMADAGATSAPATPVSGATATTTASTTASGGAATNQAATSRTVAAPQTNALGTVSITSTLVGADGRAAQGDLSGHVFTLTGAGGTFSTPPTNAQGQTRLTVPAGTYTLTKQPKAGSTLVGFSGGVTAAGIVTVTAGQATAITATNRLTATSAAPATAATTTATATRTAATTMAATTMAATTTTTTAATTAAAPRAATTVEAVALTTGCNYLGLTWPEGTSVATVAAAVTPRTGLASIWRYNSALNVFLGFSLVPGAPIDYRSVQSRLEAAFICMLGPGVLSRPSP